MFRPVLHEVLGSLPVPHPQRHGHGFLVFLSPGVDDSEGEFWANPFLHVPLEVHPELLLEFVAEVVSKLPERPVFLQLGPYGPGLVCLPMPGSQGDPSIGYGVPGVVFGGVFRCIGGQGQDESWKPDVPGEGGRCQGNAQ